MEDRLSYAKSDVTCFREENGVNSALRHNLDVWTSWPCVRTRCQSSRRRRSRKLYPQAHKRTDYALRLNIALHINLAVTTRLSSILRILEISLQTLPLFLFPYHIPLQHSTMPTPVSAVACVVARVLSFLSTDWKKQIPQDITPHHPNLGEGELETTSCSWKLVFRITASSLCPGCRSKPASNVTSRYRDNGMPETSWNFLNTTADSYVHDRWSTLASTTTSGFRISRRTWNVLRRSHNHCRW